jgi:hypothetical protein
VPIAASVVDPPGVIRVTLQYGQEYLLDRSAQNAMIRELTARYLELRQQAAPVLTSTYCIVVLVDTSVAESQLNRALFNLWMAVQREKGKVICVGYPEDSISGLATIGLLSISGFRLASSWSDALRWLQVPGAV